VPLKKIKTKNLKPISFLTGQTCNRLTSSPVTHYKQSRRGRSLTSLFTDPTRQLSCSLPKLRRSHSSAQYVRVIAGIPSPPLLRKSHARSPIGHRSPSLQNTLFGAGLATRVSVPRPVCRLPRSPLVASTGAPRIFTRQPRPDCDIPHLSNDG
jgi:hypothetical protein